MAESESVAMTPEEEQAALAAILQPFIDRAEAGGQAPLIGGIPEGHSVPGQSVTLVVPGPPTAASIRAFQKGVPNFDGTITQSSAGTLVARSTPGEAQEAKYREGDEFKPASWSEEKRARLLKGLSSLGLLQGEWSADNWTEAAADAYYQVLTFANINVKDDEWALNTLLANPQLVPGVQQAQFTLPAYTPPDPATLRTEAEGFLEDRLGRPATPQELASLAQDWLGYAREEYDQETVPLARANFDTQVAAQQGLAGPTVTVEDVDPAARFKELFERRYAPEIARREAVNEQAVNRQSLGQSLFGIDSLIAGG